jgi:hypothetical protein
LGETAGARTPGDGEPRPKSGVRSIVVAPPRCDRSRMPPSVHLDPHMTPDLIRDEIQALYRERRDARDLGLDDNTTYMASLDADLDAWRRAYAAASVTEVASARAERSGRLVG